MENFSINALCDITVGTGLCAVFTLFQTVLQAKAIKAVCHFRGVLLAVQRRTLFLEMTCKANFANEGPSLNCTDSAKRLCSKLVNRGSCSKMKADQTLETAVLRQL